MAGHRRGLFTLGAAAAAGAATFLGGSRPAAARPLEEVLRGGELRVGVNPTLPPRAQFEGGTNIVGFEPDVATAIAAKLGVRLTFQAVGSAERIPLVASGRIDFVMGAMSRTSDRAKVIDFSVPVHSENYGIVTTEAKGFRDVEALNSESVTLAQVRGTTALPFIQRRMPKARVLLLDNYPDRNRAMAQGRADASFDGLDALRFSLRPFSTVRWLITPIAEYGTTFSCLGVAKNNHSLRLWLNVALTELHADGTIEAAWEKWFDGPMLTKVPFNPYY